MNKLLAIFFVFVTISGFSQIPDGYYDNAEGLTGTELKTALHNIIDHHTTFPYTDSGTDTWDILKEADRDPGNSANVVLIYTGFSVDAEQEYNNGDGWTREHVWAKSHGDFDTNPPAGTDAHNLKPSLNAVNTARSDKDFDNGGTAHSIATECNYDEDSWEPRDDVKGDVARIMFYMVIRYEGDVSGEPDLELVDHITTYPDPEFGVLSTLLEWHSQDPVDDFERNRNDVIYSYQGNRNPFIDHPEYVSSIFGDVNNAPVINDQTFSIAENSANGTEVGTIVASDPDQDNISFSITSGNTNNVFALNSSTGVLIVNNYAELDYNIHTSFSLEIEVSDGNLTSNATITINVDQANPVEKLEDVEKINIYPNPVTDYLNIKIPDNQFVEIYSVIGKLILTTNQDIIDVSGFNQGMYFVVVKNESGKTVKSIKVLKK